MLQHSPSTPLNLPGVRRPLRDACCLKYIKCTESNFRLRRPAHCFSSTVFLTVCQECTSTMHSQLGTRVWQKTREFYHQYFNSWVLVRIHTPTHRVRQEQAARYREVTSSLPTVRPREETNEYLNM